MFSPLQGGAGNQGQFGHFLKFVVKIPTVGHGTLIKIPAHGAGTKIKVQLRYIEWTTLIFNIFCTGCRKYQTHKKLFRHTFSMLYICEPS